MGPPVTANGFHAHTVSCTKITYEPEGGAGDLTWKLHPTVPSGPSVQEEVPTGVPDTVGVGGEGEVPPVKPEPITETAVPDDPMLGERAILGITVKDTVAPVVEFPLGYVVTMNSVW